MSGNEDLHAARCSERWPPPAQPRWSNRESCSPEWPPMCRAWPADPPANCSARCRCSAIVRRPRRSASSTTASGSMRGSITDLSLLEPGKLITPNELAYIRTEIPAAAANHQGPWTLEASGLLAIAGDPQARRPDAALEGRWARTCSSARATAATRQLRLDERRRVGRHSAHRSGRAAQAVQGRDRRAGQRLRSHRPEFASARSSARAGCSRSPSLDRLGAFLATRMNGAAACPADHGKPVRLVVPGWYGCSWIKWVNEIRLVGPDEPATTQMVEFATRTHQTEPHKLAARLTRRPTSRPRPRRSGSRNARARTASSIASSASSGAAPSRSIVCRSVLASDAAFTPFSVCPTPKTHTMWSLWEYRWKPTTARHLRHRARSRGSVGAAAPSQDRLLHAPGEDRRDLIEGFQRFHRFQGFQKHRSIGVPAVPVRREPRNRGRTTPLEPLEPWNPWNPLSASLPVLPRLQADRGQPVDSSSAIA